MSNLLLALPEASMHLLSFLEPRDLMQCELVSKPMNTIAKDVLAQRDTSGLVRKLVEKLLDADDPSTFAEDDAQKLIKQLEWCIKFADWDGELRPLLYRQHLNTLRRADPSQQGDQGDHQPSTGDMTGLGSLLAIDPFVRQVKQIQQLWASLETSNARAQELLKACNEALASIGVHPIKEVYIEHLPGQGNFNSKKWRLRVRKQTMALSALGDSQAEVLADNSLHESRHCEQYFRAARCLAGQKLTASDIEQKLGIPIDVAEDAVKKPLLPEPDTQELLEAKTWAQEFGSKESQEDNAKTARTLQLNVEALGSRRAEAQKALNRLQKAPTSKSNATSAEVAGRELAEMILIVMDSYSAYRQIPSEIDAHEVGILSGEYFKRT